MSFFPLFTYNLLFIDKNELFLYNLSQKSQKMPDFIYTVTFLRKTLKISLFKQIPAPFHYIIVTISLIFYIVATISFIKNYLYLRRFQPENCASPKESVHKFSLIICLIFLPISCIIHYSAIFLIIDLLLISLKMMSAFYWVKEIFGFFAKN